MEAETERAIELLIQAYPLLKALRSNRKHSLGQQTEARFIAIHIEILMAKLGRGICKYDSNAESGSRLVKK